MTTLRRLPVPLLALALLLPGLLVFPSPADPAAAGCLSPGERRPGEIRFLVLGDWGRQGKAAQPAVAHRMGETAAEGADFVIAAGDNFYENGVTGVDDEAWESSFRNVYTSPCLDVPWHPVLGNHDYRGKTAAQVDFSGKDSRWTMPGRYYSILKGIGEEQVLFVFLDTSPFVEKYRWQRWKYPDLRARDTGPQLTWLEKTLAESEATWKIVTGHHPVFSAGRFHGPTRELRDLLPPLFEKYGVDVYFAGHEHNLQHLKPEGTTHYVISGGGSGARSAGFTRDTLFAAGAAGFVYAVLTRRELRLRFVDSAGSVLHEASLSSH